MNLFAVAQYGPLAASSRTRVFQYLDCLEARGIRVDLEVVVPDGAVARSGSGGPAGRAIYYLYSFWRALRVGWRCVRAARRYDAILVQKVLFPAPVSLLMRFFRRKVIFDFDDAIFTTEAPGEGWMARLRTHRHRRGLPRMLRAAHHAIVENAYTRAYARAYCPGVSIITGPIDTARYCPGERTERETVVLGWIGSRSTTRYLEMVREPLSELGRRHAHLRLCLIGAGAFEVEGLAVERRRWSLETEVADLRGFDIGLMPLPDDPWTRGKGGYKLLQYFAIGIPAVASPVGINREIVEDGVSGFLACGAAEWIERLERLIGNPALRRAMGAEGRRRVEARYSLEHGSRRLVEILESVAGGHGSTQKGSQNQTEGV